MFTPFAKLLCAAAFASAALAQSISIASPPPGTSVKAGTSIIVELERPTPNAYADITEISLVIGTSSCGGPCSAAFSDLGTVVYKGVFSPQSTNSAGNQYENITVLAPNWFNGPGAINVAHYYLDGVYGTPKLEFATTAITVTASTG